MDKSGEWLAALAGLALAASSYYRWACRERVRRVQGWVRGYLAPRYGGEAPRGLMIDCSDDRNWPVLVSFDDPRGGPRIRLRFRCRGGHDTLRMVESGEGGPSLSGAAAAAGTSWKGGGV